MTVREEIHIDAAQMLDVVASVNEIVKVVASVGLKHDLDWRVGSAMLVAALEIVESGHDVCDCDGCADVVGRIAARLHERWEDAVNKSHAKGVH